MKRLEPLQIFVATVLLLGCVVWGAAQEFNSTSPSGSRRPPPLPPETVPAPAGMGVSFLTLQDAIQTAVRCNPDLRAAEERTRIADAILARARSEFYPRLGISEDFAATNNAAQAFMYLLEQGRFSPTLNFNNSGVVDDFHSQLLVQQGVYTGGRRMAETQAAEANRRAASFGLAAVQNELAFRVAEAYYRVFQARELAADRQQSVRQVEQHLEIVRHASGRIPR